MRGLYAIVDLETIERHKLEPIAFSKAVLEAGASALQLRDKRGRAAETLAQLESLQPLCEQHGALLIANDRPDLAALANCGGLHVGQDDLPPSAARSLLASTVLIGMSVHNQAELKTALDQTPDYLAFGPVFATQSKVLPHRALGIEGLRDLGQRARRQFAGPLVAIGGVTLENARQIGDLGMCGAVIGALLPPPGHATPYLAAQAQARKLHEALCSGSAEGAEAADEARLQLR